MKKSRVLAGTLAASLVLSSLTLPGVSAFASQTAVEVSLTGACVLTYAAEFTEEDDCVLTWLQSYGAPIEVTKVTIMYDGEEVDVSDYGEIDGGDSNYIVYLLDSDNESYFEDSSTLDLVTAVSYYITLSSTDFDNDWHGGAIGYYSPSGNWKAVGQWTTESEEKDPGKAYYLYLEGESINLDGTLAIASGMCGDDLFWTLAENGTLTIYGTGDMYEYSSVSKLPWYDMRESVTSIVVDGATNIADGAFWGCTNATSVDISDTVISIGSVAFDECSSLTSVDIPSGVTTIGYQAFSDCTSLTSVSIPNTVTEIGGYAFSHCTSLENVSIPDSVTTMGAAVFNYCTSLKSIYIPVSVTDMSVAVGQFCTSLESVTVDEDNEAYVSIDDIIYTKDMTTLVYCMTTKEGSIVVPDTVTTIEAYAFVECTGITNIEMPDTVSEIGTFAFFDCTGITEIDLPDGLTTLSIGLLAGCSGITSLEIPEGVTCIEYDAFSRCTSMTTIWMSTGITEIGAAFYDCSSLTDVYYSGTETEWNAIDITMEENQYLFSANIHYNTTLGDVNMDGEINYLDAMMVLRYDAELISLSDEQMTVGDVNDDGSVNSLDAILILRYDAGLITSF